LAKRRRHWRNAEGIGETPKALAKRRRHWRNAEGVGETPKALAKRRRRWRNAEGIGETPKALAKRRSHWRTPKALANAEGVGETPKALAKRRRRWRNAEGIGETPKALANVSPGLERSDNPGSTAIKNKLTLKGFATRETLSGFNAIYLSIPRVLNTFEPWAEISQTPSAFQTGTAITQVKLGLPK
jgi:hypothetical protein